MIKSSRLHGIIFLMSLCLGFISLTYAEWQAVGGDVNPNTTKYVDHPSLSISTSGSLYVAYVETQFGNTVNAYVRQYAGGSWNTVVGSMAVNANSYSTASRPSLAAVSSSQVCILFQERVSTGQNYIYFRKYNGTAWENLQSMNANPLEMADYPALASNSSGSELSALWSQKAGGLNFNIYGRYSTSGTWAASDNLNVNASRDAYIPSVAFVNGQATAAWSEGITPYQAFSKYRVAASTWNPVAATPMNVQSGSDIQIPAVRIASSPSGTKYTAWIETNPSMGGEQKVFVKRWNGSDWTAVGESVNPNIGGSPAYQADSVALTVADDGTAAGVPYVAWCTSGALYASYWNGSAWEALGGNIKDVGLGGAAAPCLATYNNKVYIAFHESNTGDYRIAVKRWDAPVPATPTVTVTPTVTPTSSTTTLTPRNNPAKTDQAVAYPLPASKLVTLAYNSSTGENSDVTILVYNSHYRLVKKLTGAAVNGQGTISWDVSDVAPGVYFYATQVGTKKIATQRLVIAR